MRGTIASLVLSVTAWSFMAPMALALTGADKPACCRRNGKHHCMSGMSGISASDSNSPVFRALPSCCPYRSEVATQPLAASLQARRTFEQRLPSAIRSVTLHTITSLPDHSICRPQPSAVSQPKRVHWRHPTKTMAAATGLERAASRVTARRSNELIQRQAFSRGGLDSKSGRQLARRNV